MQHFFSYEFFCEQLLAAHEFSSEKTFGEDLHFISRVLNAGVKVLLLV